MELTTELIEYFQCENEKLKARIKIEINKQSCWLEYEETTVDDCFLGILLSEINLINVDFAEQVALKILEGVEAIRGAAPRT